MILPKRIFPPVEYCLGTSANQAQNGRLFLNNPGSGTLATTPVATCSPTPGLEFGKVSINISPKQLLKPGFTEDLLAKLARQGLSSRQIELEVTETSVRDNPDKGIAILKQLANAGFNLALDDFGTGYSSLEYLKLMPVDKLKIDRAFIRDLAVNNKDSAIAKIIVDMGSALGYQVLAEGVETKEQLDILASFSCNVIQGFYYSKPLHVADLESKLSNRELTREKFLTN